MTAELKRPNAQPAPDTADADDTTAAARQRARERAGEDTLPQKVGRAGGGSSRSK